MANPRYGGMATIGKTLDLWTSALVGFGFGFGFGWPVFLFLCHLQRILLFDVFSKGIFVSFWRSLAGFGRFSCRGFDPFPFEEGSTVIYFSSSRKRTSSQINEMMSFPCPHSNGQTQNRKDGKQHKPQKPGFCFGKRPKQTTTTLGGISGASNLHHEDSGAAPEPRAQGDEAGGAERWLKRWWCLIVSCLACAHDSEAFLAHSKMNNFNS